MIAPGLAPIAIGLAASAFEAMRELTQRVSASTRAAIHDRSHVQEAAADAAVALRAACAAHSAAAGALWDAAERGDDTVPARHAVASWIDAFRPLKAAAGRVALGLDPDHAMF